MPYCPYCHRGFEGGLNWPALRGGRLVRLIFGRNSFTNRPESESLSPYYPKPILSVGKNKNWEMYSCTRNYRLSAAWGLYFEYQLIPIRPYMVSRDKKGPLIFPPIMPRSVKCCFSQPLEKKKRKAARKSQQTNFDFSFLELITIL